MSDKHCKFRGCKATVRGKWCDEHRAVVRQRQLREANARHQRRRRRGLPPKRPKLLHAGRPTAWALKHPEEAAKIAASRGRSIEGAILG